MKKFWFPFLLFIVLTAGLVALIWWEILAEESNAGRVLGITFTAIAWFFILIFWPAQYGFSVGQVAKMMAFLGATKKAYEYTVTATQEIEIKAIKESQPSPQQILKTGELAYLNLAPEASARIKELRQEVEWYNKVLTQYTAWNSCWFTKGFIPDVPPELVPIVLE